MSKSKRLMGKQKAYALFGLALAVTLVLIVGMWLQEHGPGNMGRGFVSGGLIALVGMTLAVWRASKGPNAATTFERAFTQTGDERDDAVLTHALAVLGLSSVPLTGVAAVALALDVDPAMVMALLLFGQIAIGAVAFIVINRQR